MNLRNPYRQLQKDRKAKHGDQEGLGDVFLCLRTGRVPDSRPGTVLKILEIKMRLHRDDTGFQIRSEATEIDVQGNSDSDGYEKSCVSRSGNYVQRRNVVVRLVTATAAALG